MLLHLHEWGNPGAPPLVCLHGVTGHGRRFRRLAEERWARSFRVLAPDLRGHGLSGYEPPWTFATYADDVLETIAAAGVERAVWVGHSFGGRLVLELFARAPERIERAVLLDPAIQVLPHVALDFAEQSRQDQAFASLEDAVAARLASTPTNPREAVEEDYAAHLAPSRDGLLRARMCRSAVVSVYGELATESPPPQTVTAPTLLVYAPAFGLVREDQLEAYTDRVQTVAVPGGHVVFWDAYEQTAAAVDEFLAS